MELDFARLRSSIRATASALRFRPEAASQEVKVWRRLLNGESMIGTVGLDLKSILTVLIWRTMFRPRGTAVVVASSIDGREIIRKAEKMVLLRDEIRKRIWILEGHKGLCSPTCEYAAALHDTATNLLSHAGWLKAPSKPLEDVLVIVPNIDLIPGYFLKEAAELAKNHAISLLVNAVPAVG